MASVLVHIEADGAVPAAASLRVLGEGRRIATSLGATLYAHLQLASELEIDIEEIARTLGRGGADKVIVRRAPGRDGPPLWTSHGAGLQAACEELLPRLVLLAGDATGAELGPRLAATIGAAFVPEPTIERGPRGELVLARAVYGATHYRRLASEELDTTIVATLPARGAQPASGWDEAELRVVDATDDDGDGITYLGCSADDAATIEQARIVVVAGAGVASFETYALVEQLAQRLGGELAATRSLCAKGIAPAEREIGIGARGLAPDLLVVCGAAGSSGSLGALSGNADVVAIDRDPEAPIFRIAHYGLVGELETVLPALLEALPR